jgi:hypothetical protein
MFAADRCPGNCLKALHLDSFSTDLTGAVLAEFHSRQCAVYGLDVFLPFFVQYCQNNGEILDSKAPSIPMKDYAYAETRYKTLTLSQPEEAKRLMELAQGDVRARYQFYQQLAGLSFESNGNAPANR